RDHFRSAPPLAPAAAHADPRRRWQRRTRPAADSFPRRPQVRLACRAQTGRAGMVGDRTPPRTSDAGKLLTQLHADATRLAPGGANEAELHLVRRLLAKAGQPRRIKWVVRVLGAVVEMAFDNEARPRLDRDRLLEEVGLLPVVVPVLDVHEHLLLA